MKPMNLHRRHRAAGSKPNRFGSAMVNSKMIYLKHSPIMIALIRGQMKNTLSLRNYNRQNLKTNNNRVLTFCLRICGARTQMLIIMIFSHSPEFLNTTFKDL